jgi:lipid II:glycine glycyltransferase (peptidoglycan interpeptide bridge formation enzyme)
MTHGASIRAAASELLASSEADWDAFVEVSAVPSMLQLSGWGAVKRLNGWRALRLMRGAPGGRIGLQVLVRPILPGGLGVAYAPRGPVAEVWTPGLPQRLTALLRDAAPLLRAAAVLRIDPEVEAGVGADLDGALGDAFEAAGWRRATSVQGVATRLVDLAADEGALWSDLRKKWRQYVNLARSRGVRVVESDAGGLPTFYAMLAETYARTGTPIRSFASYQAVWEAFAPAGRARLLLAVAADGGPAAGLLLVRVGDWVAEPYGGMTAVGADLRANYLLKWEAIRSSRAAGAGIYDLGGLVNEGIDFFKAGFGGREVYNIGGFELDLGVTRARVWRRIARLRGSDA